jgi:hypothetical protein
MPFRRLQLHQHYKIHQAMSPIRLVWGVTLHARAAAERSTRNVADQEGSASSGAVGDNYPTRPIDQGFEESLMNKSGGIGPTRDRPNDYFDPLRWSNGREYQAKGLKWL